LLWCLVFANFHLTSGSLPIMFSRATAAMGEEKDDIEANKNKQKPVKKQSGEEDIGGLEMPNKEMLVQIS